MCLHADPLVIAAELEYRQEMFRRWAMADRLRHETPRGEGLLARCMRMLRRAGPDRLRPHHAHGTPFGAVPPGSTRRPS